MKATRALAVVAALSLAAMTSRVVAGSPTAVESSPLREVADPSVSRAAPEPRDLAVLAACLAALALALRRPE
jgi:hypothetical protein